MNGRRPFLAVAGWMARLGSDSTGLRPTGHPRILVIRRNRLGDMICTLPLLRALRCHYPQAHLAVACDSAGAPIAAASGLVDEVTILHVTGIRILSLLLDAGRLRGFDWVIAAKGGFDRRVATLARLTGGRRRVGFEAPRGEPSLYYTDPIPPWEVDREHQIETMLRLLPPLGIEPAPETPLLPPLEIPASATQFADALFAAPPLQDFQECALVNISSTSPLGFRPEDFVALAGRLVKAGQAVLFVAAPADQARARDLAGRCGSRRVAAAATPGPLDLAAVMKKSAFLITPEGGAAHLAAAVGLPAVVLWSMGPFEKWHSRAENHVFVRAEPWVRTLTVDQVWKAVEALLAAGKKAS